MNPLIEGLKLKADPKNARAMKILESRGLKFLVHFGYLNAADRLKAMNKAMKEGRLYEHMAQTYCL